MKDKIKFHSYRFWENSQNEKNITVYDNIIARATSIEEAVFIRRIIYLWKKFKQYGEMFIVPEKFSQPIGMSVYQFRKIVKKWEQLKLIRTESKGLPIKKWYQLDENAIANYLSLIMENEIYKQEHNTKQDRYHIDDFGVVGNDEDPQVNEIDNLSYRNRQLKLSKSTTYIIRKNKKKNNSVSPDGHASLFGDIKKKSFFDKATIKLIKALQNKNKIMRSPDRKKWSNQLKLLYTKDKVPKKLIKEVLLWYSNNIGKKYVPDARSAETFRKKFDCIYAAMQRDQIFNEDKDPIEISEEAKNIARDLSSLIFPKGSDDQVLPVIQKSLNNYDAFCEKQFKLKKKIEAGKTKIPKHRQTFALYISECLPSSRSFIAEYMKRLHKSLYHWEEWNGDLMRYVFKVSGRDFKAIGRKYASNWNGDTSYWDVHLDLLNKEIK